MNKKLHIKEGGSRTVLDLGEIIYMEKYKSKIVVYTLQRQHRMYRSFSSLEPELDRRFMRPHESYIINMDGIYAFDGNDVILKTGERITLGRDIYRVTKNICMEYFEKKQKIIHDQNSLR